MHQLWWWRGAWCRHELYINKCMQSFLKIVAVLLPRQNMEQCHSQWAHCCDIWWQLPWQRLKCIALPQSDWTCDSEVWHDCKLDLFTVSESIKAWDCMHAFSGWCISRFNFLYVWTCLCFQCSCITAGVFNLFQAKEPLVDREKQGAILHIVYST